MMLQRFRRALLAAMNAGFAERPNDEETQRLFAIVEQEYAALSWWGRKYADFLVWRCNRAVKRVFTRHGLTP